MYTHTRYAPPPPCDVFVVGPQQTAQTLSDQSPASSMTIKPAAWRQPWLWI